MQKLIKLIASKTITTSLLLFTAVSSFAQSADAPEAAVDVVVKSQTLGQLWKAGGFTMYPLSCFAIAAIALIVYNFIVLREKKFLTPESADKLMVMLNDLKVEEARQFCETTPSAITNIIGAGLARVNEKEVDMQAVDAAMEEASAEELSGSFIYINYLSTVATLSPMLGLFGTVSGMIKAFGKIAADSNAANASKLADNISEALLTTATGMIISIPAMFFYFFFKNKYGSICSKVGRIVGDIMFTFKSATKFGPQEISGNIEENAK